MKEVIEELYGEFAADLRALEHAVGKATYAKGAALSAKDDGERRRAWSTFYRHQKKVDEVRGQLQSAYLQLLQSQLT